MSDYISREWLLNEYDRQHKGPAGNARKLIENAPAADVAPVVRGRWVEEPDRRNHWHCSECGYVIGLAGKLCGKFCENCGARMDEVSE